MRYSWQLRQQAQREMRDSNFGRTRMRLQVLVVVAFIALLLAGPIAVERDARQPPISEQAENARAQRAIVRAEEHRKAVFDERKRVWEQREESKDKKIVGGMDTP